MKKCLFRACFAVLILCSVSQVIFAQETATTGAAFGKTFQAQNPVPFKQVPEQLAGKDTVSVQTTGLVKEVCQMKGCWMKVDAGNGQEMMVRFKDYGFFVPKDIVGKTIVLNGKAFQQTLSVAQLRHYAEDAGKSAKEVAKIKKPQTSLQFEADGVYITEK